MSSGVHNAKAEECTTFHSGSRNIQIKIGGCGLPKSYHCCYSCRHSLCKPVALSSLRSIRNGSRSLVNCLRIPSLVLANWLPCNPVRGCTLHCFSFFTPYVIRTGFMKTVCVLMHALQGRVKQPIFLEASIQQ